LFQSRYEKNHVKIIWSMAWESPEDDTPRYVPNIITLNSLPYEWEKINS